MSTSTPHWSGPGGEPNQEPSTLQRLAGDPVSLGLAAFGTSAFTIGSVLAGWWPHTAADLFAVGPLLFVFGGIAQFLAGMWSYARGQTVAATFFATFSSLFGAVGLYEVLIARASTAPIAVLGPLAVGLGCFAFIALYTAVGLLFSNPGFSLTAVCLAVALAVLSWSFFASNSLIADVIAGWAAIAAGTAALLTAAATAVVRLPLFWRRDRRVEGREERHASRRHIVT